LLLSLSVILRAVRSAVWAPLHWLLRCRPPLWQGLSGALLRHRLSRPLHRALYRPLTLWRRLGSSGRTAKAVHSPSGTHVIHSTYRSLLIHVRYIPVMA
jgi:hypothetical protein